MIDNRVDELERQVSALRVSDAAMKTSLVYIADDVRELTAATRQLTEAVNRSRGALWVIGGLSAIAIGISEWILRIWKP